jgi:anti-sigma regulatory factor (Ser/Thr protein kinase)
MEVDEVEAVPELVVPAPASPVRPAAARAAGRKAQFPIVVTCANCSVGVEVPDSGNYMCPRCSTVLYVDGQGSVNFFAPKKPMPIQMTLVSSPECTESFLQFFTTMTSRLKMTKADIDMATKGIHEVLNKIAQEAYLAKPSTYHILFVVGPGELVVRTSDHGRMLNGADASSTFPIAAQAFDEFEITTHPKGGNLVKMVKKLK